MTANAIGSWLLTYAVHSSLLLGLAWVGHRWLVRPAVREALWKTALVGGLATATLQPTGFGTGTATLSVGAPTAPPAAVDRGSPGLLSRERSPQPLEGAAGDVAPESPSNGWADLDWPMAGILVSLWSAIAGTLVLGFGFRRWQLARRLGKRVPVHGHPAVEELAQLAREAGMSRSVVLTVCDRLSSPIVVGFSEVSVPTIALRELDGQQRRSMLAHELAHLIRFDPAWLSVAVLLERVFFFQPLNRLARRRIQADAEFLCDAWAAEKAGSGVILAKCLVKVAEWIDAAPRPIPIAGMAEERSQLVDRVRHLVEEGTVMPKPRRRLIVAGVAGLLLVTAFVAPKVKLVGQDPSPRAARHTGAVAAGISEGVDGRGVVAQARGQTPQDTNSAVVPALLEALKDPNAEVRRAAAQSLGNIGDRRATSGLIAVLADQEAEVRLAATQSLGNLEDPRSIDGLAARLTDPVTDVRRAAIHALSSLDGKVSADLFRPALDDADPEIRASAARAVGNLKDQRSMPALVRLVGDKNADVRQAAISALGDLGLETVPAGVLDALRDPKADVRQAAAWLVGEVGEIRAVPSLKQLLGDPNADVREAAVNALSEIRDAAAIDALVTALKSSDPVVRRAAAEALGQRHER